VLHKNLFATPSDKKIRYLVTFVSVAAGSRAHRWLEEKGIKNYTLLPIPDGITKHCGLVR
jgi:hypothetical protein